MYYFNRDLLYFPTDYVSHDFFEFELHNEGVELKIIVANTGKNKAILYFGGNAESVAYNVNGFRKRFPDHTVYFMNYRGYGGSTGSPNEKGLYSDALALYDFIKDEHKEVSVIGRSLGSGIATYLAEHRKVAKTALITPYDSIEHIASDRFFFYPVSLMLQDKYHSASRAKNIMSPVLILAASDDRIVDWKYTKCLIDAFPEKNLQVIIIKRAGHNDIECKQEYQSALKDWFLDK